MDRFNPQIIAFYLPQYHPTKENNEWYGDGFTEWTNVAKAKPCFRGHIQPKIPADLGFYDLRLPEVREQQAKMAKDAGISAFCYYDYWFGGGKTMLDLPLKEILKLKKPDFPFCLCWANHSWFKKDWNPNIGKLEQKLLMEQKYPGKEDIIAHFNNLLPAFKDSRYYKIDGKLVYMILGLYNFPHFSLMKDTWNQLAKENGLPEFYFLSYTANLDDLNNPDFQETEATAISLLTNISYKQNYSLVNRMIQHGKRKLASFIKIPLLAISYKKAMKYLLHPISKRDDVIPVIFPNWDYTPRRGYSDLIFYNATPELFKEHTLAAFDLIKDKPTNRQIVFLKSWNEWGEGNYMEPDLEYGRGRLNALKDAIAIAKRKYNV